jgi:hypothetical protein
MRNYKEYKYPKRLSFPTAALVVEEAKSAFIMNPWGHWLEANGGVLKKFMVGRSPQAYIPKPPKMGEAFWLESGLDVGLAKKVSGAAGA